MNIIPESLKDFIPNLLGSFNNLSSGWSGKKLTIFVVTITCFVFPIDTWVIWAYKHNDFSLLSTVLTIVASVIVGLFGANIVDKFKNKIDESPK